jgi:DNA-binding transcriptional MocR family regulator
VRSARRKYAEQVQRYLDAVNQFFPEGTRLSRPAGGYVFWVELPRQIDSAHLATRALERKICIAPGPIFSAAGKYRNCIRLTCAQPWSAQIEVALKTLGELCKSAK